MPEAPGGEHQFDHRFSWLRDSALGLSTAVLLGHVRAGGRYIGVVAELLDRCGEHLQPLTTTSGRSVPAESEVDGVGGGRCAAGPCRQRRRLATSARFAGSAARRRVDLRQPRRAVGALALVGDVDRARRRADDMCAVLPPVLAEHWDTAAGEALGNTPLLWSHAEAARAL